MENRRRNPSSADRAEAARRRHARAQRAYERRLRERAAPRPDAVERALAAALRAWMESRESGGMLPAERDVLAAVFRHALDHLTAAGYDRQEAKDRLHRALHPRRLPPKSPSGA